MSKKHFVLGGDLKKSLTEGYQLEFKSLFRDAWAITKKNYLALVVASLFTFIVLGYSLLVLLPAAHLNENQQLIVSYMITLIIAPPLFTGLQMMGVNHSVGLKSKSIDLFNYFNIILKLSLATMIISLISNTISVALTTAMGDVGMALSLVLLLYLNMTFSLVYPLIAEKKVTPKIALVLSFKLVNKNLGQFTLLFVMIVVLAVIAVVPSGLGMFIFIPFYFNLMGIVYRQICGVGVVAIIKSDDEDDEDDEDDDDDQSKPPSSEFEA